MCAVRVLVVDDSALMRREIARIIESDPNLEVVGIARNGQEAIDKVRVLQPDVVTLDVNMPVMDGLTALTYIMMERPTPCLMVSSLTQEDALTTFEALELGAVDFVAKPSGTISRDISVQSDEIIAKVRAAARARLRKRRLRRPQQHRKREGLPARPSQQVDESPAKIVAIGVSTGGPQTLLEILPLLPADFPAPVVIAQHMPAGFTASLAKRLDDCCSIRAKEAEHNEPLLPGWAYVAPGGRHTTVVRSTLGRGPIVHLGDRPSDTPFRPSVDILFESVAKQYGSRAIGVLLTGMGDDGARGMVKIRSAGGTTIAESEETAVVFGMPKEAIRLGGAEVVAPAWEIAHHVVAAVRRIG